jgi:hypothetical protein
MYKCLLRVLYHVSMVVRVSIAYVCVHHNLLDPHVNMVNNIYEISKKQKIIFFYLIDNPCITTNPCLNSGTCFGRYNTNGSLYTQCFCLQGYTGIYCEGIIYLK